MCLIRSAFLFRSQLYFIVGFFPSSLVGFGILLNNSDDRNSHWKKADEFSLTPNKPLVHTSFTNSKLNDGKTWSRKNIFEIPPCLKPFSDLLIYLMKWSFFALKYKFSNKNGHVCSWRDFNSTSRVLSNYPKVPVKTEKSNIFNFEHVNEVLISCISGV